MAVENRFNLVDEQWIPVAGHGLVSLKEIFERQDLSALGGNPVQKIALMKLLLAIAQSAYTPKDEDDWEQLGADGLAEKCRQYLKDNKDLFWLYGEKPFLQMPAIVKAETQSLGALQTYVATGNTTVLTQIQVEKEADDVEKTLLVLQAMSFALGGKKTDNKVVLTKGYRGKTNEKGKASTGKPGPSIGYLGFLHSFLTGLNLQESIWLNLMTKSDIKGMKQFVEGVGVAPWENMPLGEDCLIARKLKNSYMGRLVPLSRFVLLAGDNIHYSEGILHPGYAEGMADLSVTVDFSKAKPKVIWTDIDKRPWRQLTALLSFFESGRQQQFDCQQLRIGIKRSKKYVNQFGVWSGGLRVSANAGEQYVSGHNDIIESEIKLKTAYLGEIWFANLKREMEQLESISKNLYGAVNGFFRVQKTDGKEQAKLAVNLFWQLCERKFQYLVDCCALENTVIELKKIRKNFAGYVNKAYDTYCPKETARQLDAWAASKPNLSKYLA
ncbi:MAG: type I-E CRISPR-associated protein Cse1/CasA [Candidatus Omnitrophota bacterium]